MQIISVVLVLSIIYQISCVVVIIGMGNVSDVSS